MIYCSNYKIGLEDIGRNNEATNKDYKYIIAVSSFILMAVAFSIVNSVNTILTAPVINARNFSIEVYSYIFLKI